MSYRETLFDVTATRERFLSSLGDNASAKNYWHVVPSWEYLIPAVRALYEMHDLWKFNVGDGGRLWATSDGLFLAWSNSWQDIQLVLGPEHPAQICDLKLIARQLLVEDAILPASDHWPSPLWLVQPSNCIDLQNRPPILSHCYMIKIKEPARLFESLPEPIAVNIKPR